MKQMITIRPLAGFEEYHACEELQQKVWDLPPIEVVPYHQLVTAARNGGMVQGAFDGSKLVGYCYGFVGLNDNNQPILCSHMLAVLPDYRGQGIAFRLKTAQREMALARGLTVMTWTYDPLEAANAYLNIHRLGGIVKHYHPDYYGVMEDGLNKGLPSDRLLVTWLLDSSHVINTIEGSGVTTSAEGVVVLQLEEEALEDSPKPRLVGGGVKEKLFVEFPSNFQKLKKEQPELALEWRLAVREALSTSLVQGYEIVDVARPRKGVMAYILTKEEKQK